MRVLGIAGSPRRGGNTDLLLAEVLKCATGKGAEVKTINVCDLDIAPCRHCDDCLETGDCSLDDDMQLVYREMEGADRVVLASPLFFMGITAQMKAMIDRCQALWARKYRLQRPPLGDLRRRKGIFIGVGGLKTADFKPAITTVKALFTSLDIGYAGELVFPGIDEKGAIARRPGALKSACLAGQKLVED